MKTIEYKGHFYVEAAPGDENDPEVYHQKELEETGFWGSRGAGSIVRSRATGRILLAYRSADVQEPHTWGAFGGAIDRKEQAEKAARRELREELGSNIKILKMTPLFVFKKGDFQYHNFLVEVDKEFEPRLNWETEKTMWFTPGEWPRPLHFGLKALFADAKSRKIILGGNT